MPRRRTLALALGVAAGAAALAAGGTDLAAASRPRLRALGGADARASLPFSATNRPACDPSLPQVPEILGPGFDPDEVDEIASVPSGNALAWTTLLGTGGIPQATRDLIVFRDGPGAERVSDAAGDNDQPSVAQDRFGVRVAWRGSAAARGTSVGNIWLRTYSPAGGDGEGEGAAAGGESVQITRLVAAATDDDADVVGTAYDPSVAARTRTRDVGSGVKVVERDARVAFVSDGDLDRPRAGAEGRNALGVPQLFLWRERGADFVQLTDIRAEGFAVRRPSIAASGQRIAFECDADLDPEAVDPKDPSRVGNPDGVRQIFLWDAGRGIRQLTWSDRDCLAPRLAPGGRAVYFCSRGEPIAGGNPEANFEVFAWFDGPDGPRRLRQLTRTAAGQNVLPRPSTSPAVFAFWATPAVTASGGTRAACGPLPYLSVRGRLVQLGGRTDAENLARAGIPATAGGPENPVLAGPPVPARDGSSGHFVTNEPDLGPTVDDDGDGFNGDVIDDQDTADPSDDEREPDDRKVDASLLIFHVARWRR